MSTKATPETPRERPIIYSAPMVRAILEGRKSQTRRVAAVPPYVRGSEAPQKGRGETPKHQAPYFDAYNGGPLWCWWDEYDRCGDGVKCPYGVPGDQLWVRETFSRSGLTKYHDTGNPKDHGGPENPCCAYAATGTYKCGKRIPSAALAVGAHKWQSPIHMPRWASRITLEITDVRVQRVQEISEEDARAEGVVGGGPNYMELWDSINGKRAPWNSNPFVWALTFRRLP